MDARRATYGMGSVVAVAVGLALGCGEDLLAPASGTCPDFCPPEQLEVVDSLLLDVITSDSTFVGYVQPYDATSLQIYRDSTLNGESGSRAVVVFLPFSDTLRLSTTDTLRGVVTATDSLSAAIPVRGRALASVGLELLLYRVPVTVNSSTTYADLDPFFTDTAFLASRSVPDSVADSVLTVTLDASAFPSLAADSNRAAIGIALRTPSGYVQLGAEDNNDPVALTRYVQVDSSGTSVARSEGKLAGFDTFVGTDGPPLASTVRVIGGVPAARTMLRFALPSRIADSSEVVRATLVLVPSEPVLGAPNDSIAVLAFGLATDVGAKSPLLTIATEAIPQRIAFVPVGSADTVRLDVTDLVIGWTNDSTVPRAVALRALPEGGSFAELRFGAAEGALRPQLHITFVPPLQLGER